MQGYITEGAVCLFCGYKASAHDAVDEYISGVLGMDRYMTIKDGGEWPLYLCPECENETIVDQGPSYSQSPQEHQFICFDCGFYHGKKGFLISAWNVTNHIILEMMGCQFVIGASDIK